MSKVHDTINQQVRQECRACHNICFTSADPDGVVPPGPQEGYRCEACEAAGYERRDFDKSLPSPEAAIAEPVEPTPPTDPNEPTEPTEATDSTAPLDAASVEGASLAAEPEAAPGASPSQDPAENADSEARPSDEPKRPDTEGEGEVVEDAAPPAEAQ